MMSSISKRELFVFDGNTANVYKAASFYGWDHADMRISENEWRFLMEDWDSGDSEQVFKTRSIDGSIV